MPQYITPKTICPNTQLLFQINKLIDSQKVSHFFIHYFNPTTLELLFSFEV